MLLVDSALVAAEVTSDNTSTVLATDESASLGAHALSSCSVRKSSNVCPGVVVTYCTESKTSSNTPPHACWEEESRDGRMVAAARSNCALASFR